MSRDLKEKVKNSRFFLNLPDDFQFPSSSVEQRILGEYGAVFAAQGVIVPKTVMFKNEAEVSAFQSSAAISNEKIGGIEIELQTPAMEALKKAIDEAAQNNLTITPRGKDAGRRNYSGTVELWASRVNPGLAHWVSKGRLTEREANKIRSLSPAKQIPEIFRLEEKGIYFSKDLSKSIIYSVAPPGTSQHLLMLALDVGEFENARVREILARHGWFQTVVSDLPHFTFLGVKESELANLGLKKIENGGWIFWIPDI
ncbi:MAG TPA: hypothetical protein VK892_11745 [Pyrinomonadaceae bacterium]|nr:hypothetical protein [Pyrinomonadaceae bacterium]